MSTMIKYKTFKSKCQVFFVNFVNKKIINSYTQNVVIWSVKANAIRRTRVSVQSARLSQSVKTLMIFKI